MLSYATHGLYGGRTQTDGLYVVVASLQSGNSSTYIEARAERPQLGAVGLRPMTEIQPAPGAVVFPKGVA